MGLGAGSFDLEMLERLAEQVDECECRIVEVGVDER